MQLRIGIVGAHCVGKTTLSQALSQALACNLIGEQIRESVKKFEPLGYHTPDQVAASEWYPHLMFDIFMNQSQKEASAENGFVSDRTTLDYYVYYDLLSRDAPEIKTIIRDLFLSQAKRRYDVLLYLPIMFPLSGDDYRNEDVIFQHEADSAIKLLLKQYPNTETIQSYTLADRLKEALGIINRYKNYSCNVTFVPQDLLPE